MAQTLAEIHSELGLLISRLARLWRREVDQALLDHGLSQATSIPLRVLAAQGGKSIRQGVLAEEVGLEGPSLVRLIDLLEAESLVERREDPTDRRAKILHLTADGEAKAEEIDRVLRRVRAYLLKDSVQDDLLTIYGALQRVEERARELQEARTLSESA